MDAEQPKSCSVIVRSLDKAATIGATLGSLRAQTVQAEVLVIDSGSTDGTVEIARSLADRVLEIPPGSFSYGGALNTGVRATSGEIVFALSAHCVPGDDRWIERSLAHYADSSVAGTNGAVLDHAGAPLGAAVRPGLVTLKQHPQWGFSNHASSWRRVVWEQHAFREDLAASEDKEWSWRVVADGWSVVIDPALDVSTGHRRNDGMRALYRRVRKEAAALAQIGHPLDDRVHHLVRDWWTDFSVESRFPRAVRRCNPYRAIERIAIRRGTRAGARQARSLAERPAS